MIYDVSTYSGTQTQKIQAAINAALANSQGGVVYIPRGTWTVTSALLTIASSSGRRLNITIRGEGREVTKIVLANGLANPLFSVAGSSSSAPYSWLTFEDLTIDGGNYSANALSFTNCEDVRLDGVLLINFQGIGLHGYGLKHSLFHDVEFVKLPPVDSTLSVASIRLESSDMPCEGLVFESCRLENMRNTTCELIGVSNVAFLECKFHGPLPDNPADRAHNQHIALSSGSYIVSFTGCRFTNAGICHINAYSSYGLLVANCNLDNAFLDVDDSGSTPPSPTWGIGMVSCESSVILGNSFAAIPYASHTQFTVNPNGRGFSDWPSNPDPSFYREYNLVGSISSTTTNTNVTLANNVGKDANTFVLRPT